MALRPLQSRLFGTAPSATTSPASSRTRTPGGPGELPPEALTDPPFLARYHDRSARTVPNGDNDRWLVPAFAELYRVLANRSFCISFSGWPHADKFMSAYRSAGFRIVGHLLFPKRFASRTGFVRYQHEAAHLLAKGVPPRPAEPISDVIGWLYSGNKLHPTQKPLEVRQPLIEHFPQPGDLVLDPFASFGSSLLAAKTLGRRWLGCGPCFMEPETTALRCPVRPAGRG